MTLIAGFQVQDVPVLLGDFLITGGLKSYTLKKVHLIGPNLVVGWTGHLMAARPVLRELYKTFKNAYVSRSELECFLTNYANDEASDIFVRLVGWIIDDESKCFRWNSSCPDTVFYSSYMVDGSGDITFEEIISRTVGMEIHGSNVSATDQAICFALFQTCTLMADEVLYKQNRQSGFGHAYEIVFFDGKQFQFVDNILYSVMDFYFNASEGGWRTRFYPIVHKYRSFDYYSVVQKYNFRSSETTFNAITPAFDDIPDLLLSIPGVDVTKRKGFPLASDYYCLFFTMKTPDDKTFWGSLVFPSKDGNSPLWFETVNGKEVLNFKGDIIPKIQQIITRQGPPRVA